MNFSLHRLCLNFKVIILVLLVQLVVPVENAYLLTGNATEWETAVVIMTRLVVTSTTNSVVEVENANSIMSSAMVSTIASTGVMNMVVRQVGS